MEQAIQVYAIINFTVIGLSHILQPHAWVDFFVILRKLQIPSHERAHLFIYPGIAFVVLAVLLAYHVVIHP